MSTGLKITISIIIITAAVVCGGGYWYMNKQATDDKAALQTQIDSLTNQVVELKKDAVSSTIATTDETADWKTYTNDTYGFSFKYPASWEITNGPTTTSPRSVVSVKSDVPNNSKIWPGPDKDQNKIHYYDQLIINVESETAVQDWISARIASGQADTSKMVSINGQDFTEMVIQADPSYLVELIVNNNKLFSIIFDWASSRSDISSAQNQILSTFQFTR